MEPDNSKKGILFGLIVLIAAIVGLVALTQSDPAPIQDAQTIVDELLEPQVMLDNGTYEVTANDSTLTWEAEKIGGRHDGTIAVQAGTVDVENGQVQSAEVVIDMSTILTDDNGAGSPDLDEHLSSEDFFAVADYPTATLKTTSVSPAGGNTYIVVADLTIRDITNEIVFPATITTNGDSVNVTASLPVNRAAYEVGTSSLLAEIGITDEFILDIELTGRAS